MSDRAETGSEECTLETKFFDITSAIKNKPSHYKEVFLVDQPGIGGQQITEAGYLVDYGPGHFNFTFLLVEKGVNELDMKLFRHLLHNKRPVAFVRTQCDSAIRGAIDEHEVLVT